MITFSLEQIIMNRTLIFRRFKPTSQHDSLNKRIIIVPINIIGSNEKVLIKYS
jgi:hypothetical protein